ncbi:MAG: hypothetical protein KF912_10370 [Phycisphaeraceae bacterium]|nr:hypothetical protein [Phycisphaeraceae bacterium]MBX3367702.1 hypothetical protein [Phycisphaeraceae bacterium]
MTKLTVSRVVPCKPPPDVGEEISITLAGLPPKRHRVPLGARHQAHHKRFKLLREHAVEAMDGRAPYAGAVSVTLLLPPERDRSESGLNDDYAWSVVESMIACSGDSFWHDPIVCYLRSQIASLRVGLHDAQSESYSVNIKFG